MDCVRSSKRRQLEDGKYTEITIATVGLISSSCDKPYFAPNPTSYLSTATNFEEPFYQNSTEAAYHLNRHVPDNNGALPYVEATGVARPEQWEPWNNQPCGNEEYVCFGMITISNLSYIASTIQPKSRSIPVVLSGKSLTFYEENTQQWYIIAELVEEKAIKILMTLEEAEDVDLQLYCQLSRKMGLNSSKGRSEISCELRVILYGKYLIFDRMGHFIDKCCMYLQDPINCDRNVVYMNPHCLSSTEPELVWTATFSTATIELEDFSNPVDLFDQFSTVETLKEASQPIALKTLLHHHQRQGLTFLVQREHGWDMKSDGKDIWSATHDGGLGYINNITGERRCSEPSQFRGGIVADQMGLGKTLLMIGLVAMDLEDEIISNHRSHASSYSCPLLPATLIVVPFSLLQTWKYQLDLHVDSKSLRYRIFHGQSRALDLSQKQPEVILTTYDTILSEMKKYSKGDRSIHSFTWHRIILDEAHMIRDSTSQRTRAIYHLKAERRWAVSGTPIQNRLTDLASIIKFLKIQPFDDLGAFEREIIRPWKNRDAQAVVKLKMLVKFITLRRSKSILNLPERTNQIRRINFTSSEREAYESVRRQTGAMLQDSILDTADSNTNLKILPRINKMRMLCNHEDQKQSIAMPRASYTSNSITGTSSTPDTDNLIGAEFLSLIDGEPHILDFETPDFPVQSTHLSIRSPSTTSTASQLSDMETPSYCPTQSPFELEYNDSDQCIEPSPYPSSPVFSSKISAILEDVSSSFFENEKTVIFSFWVTTLQAIAVALDTVGIRYVWYNGQMNERKRQQSMEQFKSDPAISVILATISAAGVGLDLTVASQALLVEPQWNPMAEEQALSRIHRMGQTKPVRTIRYVIKETIEENIVTLQRKKAELASLTLADGKLDLGSIQGMRSLDSLRNLLK